MAGRLQQLTSAEGGIDRRRIKGGASNKTLYLLTNGYVDGSGAMVSRPGTEADATLPAGTKGLMAFNGALVVFASSDPGTMPPGYSAEIIVHPTDSAATITEIHYAGPFLGAPYVVAEWSDGSVYHYWLQRRDAWSATTNYGLGDVVEPTVPNGYAYRAHRIGNPAPLWAAGKPRTVGDVIEPTTPNGYQYTVTDVIGSNPRSGTTEPTWPTEDGATVNEDTDLSTGTGGTSGPSTPPTTLPPDVEDRYSNPGGTKPWQNINPYPDL